MKSCPTCNRTFEDTFTFCLADGSLLNAPFDPHATLVIPEPRQTEPQQIKASPAEASRKSSRSPLIMIGIGALLITGLIFFIASNRRGSTAENSNTTNEPKSVPSTSAPSVSGSETTSNNSSSGKVIDITDSNYDNEVISSKTPVLIHFWASWSIPDRELSPIVEALAKEYAGKIKVGRVDFDENAKLKEKFNVHAVPEIIVIKNGVEQERVIGTTSTENLKIVLNKYTDNP